MATDIPSRPSAAADARIQYGPDALQFGELRLPSGEGPHPVVVVIHGGFWRAGYDLGHMAHVSIALTEAGAATWNIEYRRIGNRGGGWPGTFQDVAAATDYLSEIAGQYNLDLGRVATLGFSAGGHLALWSVGRHRILESSPVYSPSPLHLKGAVSLAGVVDLRRAWEMRLSHGATQELMGGTPDRVPERYAAGSPIEMLPLGVPQVLAHGTADDNVPYEISKRYYAAAIASGDAAELLSFPGARHFELIDPQSPQWSPIEQAVKKILTL